MVLLNDSFAALAPAVQEGQRIINGMHDILKLFLTRIATVGLVLVSSLLIGEFPLELRAGSLLNLLSVGIPTMVLAAWARPGPAPKGRLFHFVLTPALATSAIGLLLFYGVIEALIVQQIGTITPHIPQEQLMLIYAAVVPVARTTLTTFLVCCGLLLVVFVEPPTDWWTGGDVLSGDWRPSLLAGVLQAAFVVIAAVPGLRAGFGLVVLPPLAVGFTALALAIWLLLVRWLWRTRAIDRFIGRA
jgi:cation-transporting ATPase E